VVNHGFCWSLNPCRVVYVLEETGGEVERYGFAFGTLPGHSEEGEERFTVERRAPTIRSGMSFYRLPARITSTFGLSFKDNFSILTEQNMK
jgi:uncharacterized protein (UPF0548 family)